MVEEEKKVRVLLTKSRIDGHDRGVRYLARKLTDAGMEIIFTRYKNPEDIVNTAMQEDADVIGISFSVGGHTVVTAEVMDFMKKRGMQDTLVIVGGIIPEDDVPQLLELGVGKTFGPGSYADDVIHYIRDNVKG
ncbi:MAG: cobalamin-dependent protein [Thermodesulfobacteriota bacterium]|nr:cobalamin-dependent protein [Thermodesulfobacteriota bacterium]